MCAACHTGIAYTLRLDVVRVTGEIRGVGVNGVEPSNVCGQAVEEVAAFAGKGREIARNVCVVEAACDVSAYPYSPKPMEVTTEALSTCRRCRMLQLFNARDYLHPNISNIPHSGPHLQHIIAQIRRIPISNFKIATVGIKLHEGERCSSEGRPHLRGGGQGGAGVEALRSVNVGCDWSGGHVRAERHTLARFAVRMHANKALREAASEGAPYLRKTFNIACAADKMESLTY